MFAHAPSALVGYNFHVIALCIWSSFWHGLCIKMVAKTLNKSNLDLLVLTL